MSAECFFAIRFPRAVSLFPFMAPILFIVPYTADGLPGYSFLSLSSRNFGIWVESTIKRQSCQSPVIASNSTTLNPAPSFILASI